MKRLRLSSFCKQHSQQLGVSLLLAQRGTRSTHWKRLSGCKRSKLEQTVLQGVRKLLKSWSGRRGSNPRRPAWEIDPQLKIQTLASMASIECDREHAAFNDLLLRSLKGSKVEQKNLRFPPKIRCSGPNFLQPSRYKFRSFWRVLRIALPQ